jgi:(E)-4-hydroxy-3-methylbut-2-enyl-diphosphate synthase
VRRCRELGRALRIGTNHGSLSDRVMNRYGDTPEGMVASALEFLDVCEDEGFRDVVFSMKASNPLVAIQAYRLLAARLAERAPDEPGYPFHVGVTEAGDGEDGRIKSAIGIGALLEDGIGDTIRVSLTEDPVKEVPVARALARHYDARWREPAADLPDPGAPFTDDPLVHVRRPTHAVAGLGGDAPVRVEVDLGPVPPDAEVAAAEIEAGCRRLDELSLEGLGFALEDEAGARRLAALADALRKRGLDLPLAVRAPAALWPRVAESAARVVAPAGTAPVPGAGAAGSAAVEWSFSGDGGALRGQIDAAFSGGHAPDAVSVTSPLPVHAVRLLVARLRALGRAGIPVVLRHRADPFADADAALVRAATDLGAPLCDGIGDAVVLAGFGGLERSVALAYRILQGARQRTSWTEFISCPSCGRTLFDLEETTARIKARTAHLPGVKIAVMGCIVNGPGEMADADFGYVGSGPGVVNLYVGHQCVVRSVPEAQAPDRLVALIAEHGRWVDPPERRAASGDVAPGSADPAGTAG